MIKVTLILSPNLSRTKSLRFTTVVPSVPRIGEVISVRKTSDQYNMTIEDEPMFFEVKHIIYDLEGVRVSKRNDNTNYPYYLDRNCHSSESDRTEIILVCEIDEFHGNGAINMGSK